MAKYNFDKPRGKIVDSGSANMPFAYRVVLDPEFNQYYLWYRVGYREKTWHLLTSVKPNITKREAMKLVMDYLIKRVQ